MRKKLSATLVFLSLIALYGCRHENESESKAIFRYNESAGIKSLDPAYAKDQAMIWACSQLYDGLIQLDSNLEVRPCIAKRWEITDESKTYTFTLRDDVYFHKNELFGNSDSTRKVTAHDFVYSFNRVLDPQVASPGLWIFNNVAENGFSAPNDTTLIIRLKESFSPFLSLLGMPYCSVVPHEVAEHYKADFRKHPCGTGPFKIQLWKEDVKLVMRKNPNYFEFDEDGTRLPYLDAIAITFIIDKQTVFLEFVKHNLDFMNSLDASYKDEILSRTGQLKQKYANKLVMTSTPYLNTEYLGFKMDATPNSPLMDKRIRQAINYGFDRRKMMKYLRNNIGTPGCKGFIPLGMTAYDCTSNYGYEYNPQKAQQLLAEAGYPYGKGLPALQLTTTSSYLDLCKYIQQQLDLIGIKIKVDVNPPAALREQMSTAKCSWFRGSWIADYPDPENYLSLFYTPNHAPQGPNYTHFSNTRFDQLYRKAQTEPNSEKRDQIYREMDSIVMEESPVIVLYYDQILHFTHKGRGGITDIRSNAMNALNLKYAKKTK